MKNNQYDVIIVGAGVVGLTLACCLPKQLRIALIEKKPNQFVFNPNHYDLRVSAINAASEIIFRDIAAWDGMEVLRVSPFTGIEVWDEQGAGKIKFDCFEIAEPRLGHIIENSILQYGLMEAAKKRENIEFLYGEPDNLITGGNNAILTLEQTQLTAKLIVGADGANSWVREQAQLELKQRAYQQQALVTTIKTELPHQQMARQVFLRDGILALLPLADAHHCSIVWSAAPAKINELSEATAINFNTAISEAMQYCLGQLEKIDTTLQFDLTMRHAKQYVKNRIALIGDAAHTIHPLAGQGVNLGIQDALQLAEIVAYAYDKKRDIGYLDTLRRYERAQKSKNLLAIKTMDGFKYLFSANYNSIIYLRNLGLQMTNKLNFLKNFFMRQVMGK